MRIRSLARQTERTLLHSLAGELLVYVLPAAVAVVVLWIVWRLLRRRKPVAVPLPPDLTVEVETLGDQGPPDGPPVLEFYNLPMRLAAVVLAPAGLGRELPPDDQLAPLLDSIIPGLDKVAALHRPLVRRWPNQVSATGFAHVFFNNAKLPGTGGKGTPWSSVAGVVQVSGQAGHGRPGALRRQAQQPRPDDHRGGAPVVGMFEGEVELVESGEWRGERTARKPLAASQRATRELL